MSSQDEVTADVVRRLWSLANVEDLRDVAERYWHEDIVYSEDPRWPGAGVFEGRDAVLARWAEYTQLIGGAQTRLLEVEARGPRAFCAVEVTGQGISSGAPTDHVWGYSVLVRDGRVTEFAAHFDPEEARRGVRDG